MVHHYKHCFTPVLEFKVIRLRITCFAQCFLRLSREGPAVRPRFLRHDTDYRPF